MLRSGKFSTALLWEGEMDMTSLSSLNGLQASNTFVQSSSINSLQGIRTSFRLSGNTEPLVTGPFLWAGRWNLSSLHSREPLQQCGESQGKQHGVQQEILASVVIHANCSTAVRAIPSTEPNMLLKSNNELQCHCSISRLFLTLS